MKSMVLVATWLGLAAVSRADVRVVSPSGPFTQIQAAVTAAVDGDTVLVKSGNYAGFRIEDKSLTVVADAGASVHVSGSVVVRILASARTVVISGLDVLGFDSTDYYTGPGLILQQNLGSVRLQDCTFHGVYGTSDPCFPRAGAEVVESADVAFTGCGLIGADSSVLLGVGGTGLDAPNSHVALYDCTVEGGRGGTDLTCSGGLGDGYPGGPGADLNSSTSFPISLFASGCRLHGGHGGDAVAGFGGTFFHGGDGGLAIQVGGPVLAVLLGGTLISGTGGGIPPGANGQDGTSPPPAGPMIDALVGRPRMLEASTVVRAGHAIQVVARGTPGDDVGLFLDRATRFEYDAQANGVHLTAPIPTGRFARIGTIPSSGVLSVQLQASLPAGAVSQTLYLQSLHLNVHGVSTLGSARELVIVDPAY